MVRDKKPKKIYLERIENTKLKQIFKVMRK